MNNDIKVIPVKIRESYTSLIMPKDSFKTSLASFNGQQVNASLKIYNDEILDFIFNNLDKSIEYIFDYYMKFSKLNKVKVNEDVFEKLVDMYAYDVRSLLPTHVLFVERDDRFESGCDIDYSDLSYKQLVLKLAEDLLFIYG